MSFLIENILKLEGNRDLQGTRKEFQDLQYVEEPPDMSVRKRGGSPDDEVFHSRRRMGTNRSDGKKQASAMSIYDSLYPRNSLLLYDTSLNTTTEELLKKDTP